jgi:hypothetical protein
LTTKPAEALDGRIASAFSDDANSSDAARLLAEVKEATAAAELAAETARKHALDPVLSGDDLKLARGEMDDASFLRDRLTEAARRLGERVAELRRSKKASAQRAEHERVSAERDRLAAELEGKAKPISEVAGLVAQIDACDREIRNINATTGLALGHIRPVLGWGSAGSFDSARRLGCLGYLHRGRGTATPAGREGKSERHLERSALRSSSACSEEWQSAILRFANPAATPIVGEVAGS